MGLRCSYLCGCIHLGLKGSWGSNGGLRAFGRLQGQGSYFGFGAELALPPKDIIKAKHVANVQFHHEQRKTLLQHEGRTPPAGACLAKMAWQSHPSTVPPLCFLPIRLHVAGRRGGSGCPRSS